MADTSSVYSKYPWVVALALLGGLIGLSASVKPTLTVVLASAVVAGILVLVRPAAGVMLLVFTIPVTKYLQEMVPTMGEYHINLDTVLLLVTLLSLVMRWRTYALDLREIGRLAAPWLALVFVHVVWSVIQYVRFWQVSEFLRACYDLAKFTEYSAFFLITYMAVRSEKETRAVSAAFLIGFVPVGLYGILQYMAMNHGVNPFPAVIHTQGSISLTRVYSTLINLGPNYYGMYLSVVLAVLSSVLVQSRSRALRVALVLEVVLLLANLYFTESRGSIVAALAGVLAVAAVQKRYGLVLLGIAVGALSVPSLIQQRFVLNGSQIELDYSALERLALVKAALVEFYQHSILGLGFNGFTQVSRAYVGRAIVVHNQYLSTLAEFGLLGSALFLASASRMVCLALRDSWRLLFRENDKSVARATLISCVGALVAFLVGNLTGNLLYYPEIIGPLAVLFGLACRGGAQATV